MLNIIIETDVNSVYPKWILDFIKNSKMDTTLEYSEIVGYPPIGINNLSVKHENNSIVFPNR